MLFHGYWYKDDYIDMTYQNTVYLQVYAFLLILK